MDTSILEDLGLTNAEIKIYLALLQLGQSTAGPIIRKTGLQNSVVHSTLPKLAEKGFITFIVKGGIREYQATNPDNIIRFIDEKKNKFQHLLPELKFIQNPSAKNQAEVYTGIKGAKAMLYDMIKDAKKGDENLFFSGEYTEQLADFLGGEYQKFREKRGLIVKGLVHVKYKKLYENSKDRRKIKFVDFPVLQGVGVSNDNVALIATEDSIVSFLIHSKSLADSFRKYFYSIWNNQD